MKKILCVIRVSTMQQEMESQHNDMAKWLGGMGYNENEIEWLESAGASARCCNAKYMKMIDDIKRITISNNIKTVAVWHINRLGRREKKLIDMKSWFIENGVQLYVKNPELHLLDANGQPDKAGCMVFSLFANMVESETEEMMQKFARGKSQKREQGQWDGATLPLGYTLTDNNVIVVDDKGAELVRQIFEQYATGDWSTTRLANELTEKGITDTDGHNFTQSRVATILSKKRYTGCTEKTKNGVEFNYPAIITTELFDKCEALRKGAKVVRKHNYASAYLCNKLIECSCGYHYTASNTTYRCFKEHDEDVNKVPQGERLNHTHVALNIDMMDSIIWRLAADMEVGKLLQNDRNKVEDYKAELTTAETKLAAVEDKLSKFVGKRDKVTDMVIDGLISKDTAKAKLAKINADEATAKAECDAVKADVKRLTAIINSLEHHTIDIDLFNRLNENLPENIEKKRAIVRTHIQKITVSGWQTMNTTSISAADIFKCTTKEKRYTLITVYDVYGYTYQYRYFPRWSFGQSRLEQYVDGGWGEYQIKKAA